MGATKPPPPPDDNLPKGDALWRILHDPSQTEEATAAAKAPAPTAPAPPAEPPADSQPAEVDASRIQRMISAPELLEPEFDYRELTAPAVRDDFDSALRHFYRETGISIKCRNHPQEEATGQCPECQAYYCLNCLVVRRGRLMCRDCAQTVFVPSEEQVISAQLAGAEADFAEIEPEAHPEFQYGGALFGLEGHPAHPGKQLLALLLDMLLTRGGVMLVLFLFSVLNPTSQWPVLATFHAETKHELALQALNAAVLLRPALPWLVIFAVVDYLYFFLSLSIANRTFGMSWMGCRIVTEWGDFVSFSAVMLRTLVFMVCLGWPALLIGWFFPAYRGPHDYAGGTLVINYAGVKRVDVYETLQIKL